MATYEVQIDFGSGLQDITSLLVGQQPVKRSWSIHNNLKPVIGTCDFLINRNTTIVNQFLTSSIDPVVIITKNSAPYFKGTVRRTVKVTVGQLRVDALKCQCVDPLYRMDGRKYSLSSVWKDYKICNPSAKNQSILHQLLYLAGYTDAELDLHLVDITIGSYAIDGTRSSLLIRDLIETVLRDCVHTLKVLPTGVITLYDLAPASYTPTATLATGAGGNIVGGYTVERDEAKAEAVDVTYWDHMVLVDEVLFEDTTGSAPGVDCSIPVPAGTYFPDGASADTAIRCVFDVKDYDLVSAASPVVEWSHTGNVAKLVEVPDGLGMFVNFYSSTGGVIIRFRIVGDATVKKNQNKISVEIVASSDEREEIKTELLTESVSAGKLAAGRAAWHKNSLYRYTITVIATTAVEPGQIVSLSDPGILGSSQTLRVISVDDGDDEKQYRAICEGVSDYGATVVSGIPIPARNSVPVRDGFSIDEILANVPMMEFRYTRSLTQPATPAEAVPAGWELYIPSGEGYGWQIRALKYADGTLVGAWEEAVRVPTTDDLDNIIDGSAILDGAIEKAKLSSGFLLEHDTVISDLATEIIDRIREVGVVQGQVDVIKPQVNTLIPQTRTLEDFADALNNLVSASEGRTIDNEYAFGRAYQAIEEGVTRTSALEINVDGISAIVAEVTPTITRVSALEIDINGITTTVGEISNEFDSPTGRVSTVEQTAGGVLATVESWAPDVSKISTIEQTAEYAKTTVQTVTPLINKVSQLEINDSAIRAAVFEQGDIEGSSKLAELKVSVEAISSTVADLIGVKWTALTDYELGDMVNADGSSYECTTAGTSGATAPTWPEEGTVEDGTVEWTYRGSYVADLSQLQINSDRIAGIVADGGYWTDDDPPVFIPTKAYAQVVATADFFEVFVQGSTSEVWAASTSYFLNDLVNVGGVIYICASGGTSGLTEPTWPGSGTVQDGTAIWRFVGTAPNASWIVTDEMIASYATSSSVTTAIGNATSALTDIIDTKVESFYTDTDPKDSWLEADYAKHTGDTWYAPTGKILKRFNGATWDTIEDAAALAAAEAASTAQETADGKRTTYSIRPETGPYDTGDIWYDIASKTVYACSTPRTDGQAGSIGDWTKTTANTADIENAIGELRGNAPVETTLASMITTASEISGSVATLWSGNAPPQRSDKEAYQAWLDEAYVAAASSFLVNNQGISLEVQDRKQQGVELNAAIVIEADRITSEVSRATESEGTLASQIIQTAEAINLAVWGLNDTPDYVEGRDVFSQLSLVQDSFSAMVSGVGSSAYLGLQITLPLEISAQTFSDMVTASGNANLVNAVYVVQAITNDLAIYVLRPNASQADFDTLRTALRTCDPPLLGSRFTVEAEELVFSGQSVFTLGGKLPNASVDGLGSLATKSNVNIADLEPTLVVNGKLKADYIEASALTIGWSQLTDSSTYVDPKGTAANLVPRFRGSLTADPASENREGDYYYNTTSSKTRAYKDAAWADATIALTPDGIGADPKDTALNLVPRFRGSLDTNPSTGNREGDYYFNTETKKLMAYLSGAWADASLALTPGGIGADIQGAGTAAAGAVQNALQPQIDGKIEAWYQASPDPADAWTTDALKLQHDGDQWYNTTSKVWRRYRRTFDPDRGEFIGIWDLLQEADALKGISDAGDALTKANTKNTIFATLAGAQATGVIGDCFLDGGLLYRATVAGNQISVANSTRLTPKSYGTVAGTTARNNLTGMIHGDSVFQDDQAQWYLYDGNASPPAWITDGAAFDVKGTAVTVAVTNPPQYRGLFTTVDNSRLINRGDWYFRASATANDRRIYYKDAVGNVLNKLIAGSNGLTDAEVRHWSTAEYLSDVMAHIKANPTHGVPSDYRISFIANLAADNAFITDLKAVTALFTDITVTGKALVNELLYTGFVPGDIVLKRAADLITTGGIQNLYSNRQICGAGTVKVKFNLRANTLNTTLTCVVVRRRSGVADVTVYSEALTNQDFSWTARTFNVEIAEGDYLRFLAQRTSGGMAPDKYYDLKDIFICSATYPGFMSWVGNDYDTAADPVFPR